MPDRPIVLAVLALDLLPGVAQAHDFSPVVGDFSAERLLPPMPKLLDAPFWLDPSDPHRMAAAMQFLTRPRAYNGVTAPQSLKGSSKLFMDAIEPTPALYPL